jgi:uncharacterized damage-inducible protein DinB
MKLTEFLSEQLDREAAASRKVLERVPEGQNGWKPHERSMELGYLAALVATMPGWVAFMLDRDELDLDAPDGQTLRTRPMEKREDLLRALDESLQRSQEALRRTSEEHLTTPWSLTLQGRRVGGGPRYAEICNGALSHAAHHRGQLTVYLRLLEAKVPAIYGPTADVKFGQPA